MDSARVDASEASLCDDVYMASKEQVAPKERPEVGGDKVEDGKAVNGQESRSRRNVFERTDKSPGHSQVLGGEVYLPDLPQYVLDFIFNKVGGARSIASAQLLCKDWRDAGDNVQSLCVTVYDEDHVKARDRDGRAKSPKFDGSGPSTSGGNFRSISEQVVKILKKKRNIVQLRIEVEAKLQSKIVPDGERRRTDFWLTNPYYLEQWLPGIGSTLEHLCIIDYGQQAIMRRSSIVKILSKNCTKLESLDLRNMFIDTSGCDPMKSMVSLTLRCVKVVGETLKHINHTMPSLQTLALLGIFGADGGVLEFEKMKVLCLGLSTPAREVVMKLPKLEKLQLKMQCPERLVIEASVLKYVAFNLEVLLPENVDMKSVVRLEELLYGATDFSTLANLVGRNLQYLTKLFLDIPCMALGEDGRFLRVLKEVSLGLPTFSQLQQCQKLTVLNIGPGLWHSMETHISDLPPEDKWPSVQTLILHMIPHDVESALTVLQLLLRPSVNSLTVFIHTSSPVPWELMIPGIEELAQMQNIIPNISSWTKALDFSCFSF